MLRNERKRASRRGWPIHGYVGPNGGGKSAAMVWDTLPSLLAGRRVLSTVRLLDFQNPRECSGCDESGHERFVAVPTPEYAAAMAAGEDVAGWPAEDRWTYVFAGIHGAAHPSYEALVEWQQLLDAESCDVLLDEVTGVASSRESMGLPAPVANKLVQLRRADVTVRFSAPAWARADKIIRETAQAVTFCRGYLAKQSGDSDRLWRQRRLFRWQTFDAQLFDDFTNGKRESLRPMVNDWHWGPGSPSFSAYDTFDSVSVVGTVTDSGRCYRCGGKRDIPRCKCGSHSSVPGEGAGEVEAGRRVRRSLDRAAPGPAARAEPVCTSEVAESVAP